MLSFEAGGVWDLSNSVRSMNSAGSDELAMPEEDSEFDSAGASSSFSLSRPNRPSVKVWTVVWVVAAIRLARWAGARISCTMRKRKVSKKAQRKGASRQPTPAQEGGGDRWGPVKTLAVLGSGGHTTEMLELVRNFDDRGFPLHFVLANSDATSLSKIVASYPEFANPTRIFKIPRSREVGQSWLSSVPSFIMSQVAALRVVWRIRPRLILVNGPGTCVPVVYAALLLELLSLSGTSLRDPRPRLRVVFVESFCRVKSLSLTGKLLYPFADRIIVSWEGLAKKYPKCEYLGGPLY